MGHNRRKFICDTAKAGLFVFLAPQLISCKNSSTAAISQDKSGIISFDIPASADFKLNAIADNFWTFEQRGGTIGLYMDKDAICVVDTQFPPQSKSLIEQIQSKSTQKIDLLINTHHHGDHTSGNPAFSEIIKDHVTHENSLANHKRSIEKNGSSAEYLFAKTVFDKEFSAKLGSETVTMKYYGAAHTDGDAVTRFENSNVVHMGDLIFNRRFPFIDTSSGANIVNWISVLDQVKKDNPADAKFVFGHSDGGYPIAGNVEDIKAFQNYLERLLEYCQKNIQSGKNLKDLIKETKFIPGAEQWKGRGVDRSLTAAYEELS